MPDAEKPVPKGKTWIGDYTHRTSSMSRRAGLKLTLAVERNKRCPYCHHHKFLVSSEHRKCARCKRWLPMSDRDMDKIERLKR
jgi:hypothetical protein